MKKAVCAIAILLGLVSMAQASGHHHHSGGTVAWWPGYYGYGVWPYSYGWYGYYYYPQPRKVRLPNDEYYRRRSSGAEARFKYEQEVLERQRLKNATRKAAPHEEPSFTYNGKRWSSYKSFKTSPEYMEMKARAWMKDLTVKAEKSLEQKKLQENYDRTRELRGMSFSKRQHYRNGKVVEKEMGKNWWKSYGPQGAK